MEECDRLTIEGGFVVKCGMPSQDGYCVSSRPHLQTKTGRYITSADIEEYADQAERGYNLTNES